MKEQRSFIVTYTRGGEPFDNTDNLNKLLKDGWSVIHSSPMGGVPLPQQTNVRSTSFCVFSSLVILERSR